VAVVIARRPMASPRVTATDWNPIHPMFIMRAVFELRAEIGEVLRSERILH
jgi:hypothetical protein